MAFGSFTGMETPLDFEAALELDRQKIVDLQSRGWQPISTAPKDRPILVWHDDDSDAYYVESANRLTDYGAWCEGASRIKKAGIFIAVWGGAYKDDESGEGWGPWTIMPDWWFVDDDEFEQPLAPTHWMPLPEQPK